MVLSIALWIGSNLLYLAAAAFLLTLFCIWWWRTRRFGSKPPR